MREVPVLIAGAGPTGLTLACELARRGVTCQLIERAPQLFLGSRAKGLQPRTLEVFDDLGVIARVLEDGAPFPPFRLYAGKAVLWERSLEEMLGTPAPAPSPGVPFPRAWLLPQWRTDAILHDRFVELGGAVEFSTELTGFAQDANGVTATLQRDGVSHCVRAQYLVGADGGRSFVRKATGVGFAGETYDTERTLIGDVRASGVAAGAACHIFTAGGDLQRRFSLWNLPGSEYFQFVATVGADEVPELSLESVQKLLEARAGRTDIRLHDLRWVSLYRIHVRMVERFRIGRVLLAGDAAHVHSSAGGQGLNTSIQDATNLGWKLAAALHGAGPGILDTYEEERLPVAAQVLGLSTTLHGRDFRPSLGPTPAIHQLDITYRGSTLAVDDRATPGELRAGDRAPDARLPDGTRLFDAFRGTHFTLLVFGQRAAPADTGARIVRTASLDGYDVGEDALVLVRPDGYIGAISSSVETIHDYLRRFVPGAPSTDRQRPG
ncbi:FAD-dependent monooxygenase [Nannocystis punicea]|uniref:FAD-dependent monooxygenase n=1 Tax=Nannocystis punicea TaxID=2995304 RepID=A0ABY7GUK1_9BACT|nr:FAD-dependent monooxygenase [Nannocystis poenicansa]WAS90575.1 FAD-dependent monooxygenase [Nannocystis poenicansa]